MPWGSGPSPARGWLGWARVLVVGMVCGGVQLLLQIAIGVFDLPPWFTGPALHWPFLLVAVLSACCYLAASFLEGYLAAKRKGTSAAGRAAGWLVGGISVSIIALFILWLIVIMLSAPRSTEGEVDPHDFRDIVAMGLLFIKGRVKPRA